MKEGGGRNRKEREKEGKEGGEEGGEGRGRRGKGKEKKGEGEGRGGKGRGGGRKKEGEGKHWCQHVYKLRRQIPRTYCTGSARLPGLVDRYTEEHH